MKEILITDIELKYKLEYLRKLLKKVDLDNNKIIFINLKAFYSYLNKYFDDNFENFIKDIEPFIPINLCINLDKQLENILNTALKDDSLTEIEINNLKSKFYEKSIINFLKLIKNTETEYEWNLILETCEDLRKLQK